MARRLVGFFDGGHSVAIVLGRDVVKRKENFELSFFASKIASSVSAAGGPKRRALLRKCLRMVADALLVATPEEERLLWGEIKMIGEEMENRPVPQTGKEMPSWGSKQ